MSSVSGGIAADALTVLLKSLLESELLPSLVRTTSVSIFGHTAPLVSE